MSSKEIYVSTDVEADGPIPGPNSMLSFGSAACTGGKELIGTFSANLETLPGATVDPTLMRKALNQRELIGIADLRRLGTVSARATLADKSSARPTRWTIFRASSGISGIRCLGRDFSNFM